MIYRNDVKEIRSKFIFNRCLVPECDNKYRPNYDEDWVQHAIPGTISQSSGHFVPEICSRFIFLNDTITDKKDTCPAHWFTGDQIKCNEWVFDENERTIVNDVG